mmetsp:Transcript_28233/g.72578  ORF Transcript_28233/g.72578 Transcript_28233/m.72578 type:complete len:113 (-) Transcript_28233:1691-2029(-)
MEVTFRVGHCLDGEQCERHRSLERAGDNGEDGDVSGSLLQRAVTHGEVLEEIDVPPSCSAFSASPSYFKVITRKQTPASSSTYARSSIHLNGQMTPITNCSSSVLEMLELLP